MLKMLGMFCILSGSTGFGLVCARELELRILELLQLQQMMLLLRGEIRYMHQPLPEAFSHLSGTASAPFGEFFRHTAQDLRQRNGQSAEEIWKKNLKTYFSGLHIGRQEQKDLEKLGGMLGCLDVEMQVNVLDYYLEQLKLSVGQARESAEKRRKLYQYMGVLGGAALVIMIF